MKKKNVVTQGTGDSDHHYYARPHGLHYHWHKYCVMLIGGQFIDLGYTEITLQEAQNRRLLKCPACSQAKKKSK